jgi:hypothetical protein
MRFRDLEFAFPIFLFALFDFLAPSLLCVPGAFASLREFPA